MNHSNEITNLAIITEHVHGIFETRTKARDQALKQSRLLTRCSANAIRAIHREESDLARDFLQQASQLVEALKQDLKDFPDLFFAGYTQDAIKEYVEANATFALITNNRLPSADDLEVECATYMNGLAESVGELRRRCLDILRQGYSLEAERLLSCMDEIYTLLVTIDYPDAVTNGLRRQTDVARSILERTRGDLTLSLREQKLIDLMAKMMNRLEDTGD
jgi:translin